MLAEYRFLWIAVYSFLFLKRVYGNDTPPAKRYIISLIPQVNPKHVPRDIGSTPPSVNPTYKSMVDVEHRVMAAGKEPMAKSDSFLIVDDITHVDFAKLGTLLNTSIRIEEDVIVESQEWNYVTAPDTLLWSRQRAAQIFVEGMEYSGKRSTFSSYPTVSNNSVTGKPDVVVDVYVIGSGIAADHNEFIGRNVVPMLNLVGDGIEGDCSGHETHVASTIFGATAGIVRSSVAANVNLYDMRVLGCDGTGTMSNTMIAIQAATDQHKARVAADSQDPTLPRRRTVVNLSLVGPRMEAINQLVESATAQGIAFVCAAGNEGVEACSTKSPASAPAAITVAASGWADLGDYQPAWSNYGTCIDFFAPGVDIYGAGYSRTSNSSYVSKSGTSMASPFVTGVIVSWLAAGWAGADDASSVAELVRLMTKASLKNQITNGQVFTPNRLVNLSPCRARFRRRPGTGGERTGYYCSLHPAPYQQAASICASLGGVIANMQMTEMVRVGEKLEALTWISGFDGKTAATIGGQCPVLYPGGGLGMANCDVRLEGLCDITA